jgi:hypothetical protein
MQPHQNVGFLTEEEGMAIVEDGGQNGGRHKTGWDGKSARALFKMAQNEVSDDFKVVG